MTKVTLIDKALLLKSTSFFSELDLNMLLPIADKLSLVNCKAGEVVFPIGGVAHRMYFIVSGKVALSDSKGTQLESINSPGFFGDEALLSEHPHDYQAICAGDCILLALSRTNLLTIMSEFPNVAINLLKIYARRSRKTED